MSKLQAIPKRPIALEWREKYPVAEADGKMLFGFGPGGHLRAKVVASTVAMVPPGSIPAGGVVPVDLLLYDVSLFTMQANGQVGWQQVGAVLGPDAAKALAESNCP